MLHVRQPQAASFFMFGAIWQLSESDRMLPETSVIRVSRAEQWSRRTKTHKDTDNFLVTVGGLSVKHL
jgi:hypothetical protein